MVEISDLHMHFGAVRALTGVSFAAPDGAITGLLGENGAGKTTTLNIVSGLHEPMRGRWSSTAAQPEIRSNVGGISARCSITKASTRGSPRVRTCRTLASSEDLLAAIWRGESSARSRPSASSRLPTGDTGLLARRADESRARPRHRPRAEESDSRRTDERPRRAERTRVQVRAQAHARPGRLHRVLEPLIHDVVGSATASWSSRGAARCSRQSRRRCPRTPEAPRSKMRSCH